MYPEAIVGGLATVAATRTQLAELMSQDCLAGRTRRCAPKLVFSSNGQGLALVSQDRDFAAVMQQADLIHADGMPVVWASKMSRTPLPERVATTDFFHDAARVASRDGLRFFMLGGSQEQNERVVQAVRRQYPSLAVVGSHHGYFADEESPRICQKIRESGADVLWVGLGKPRQEFWSVENQENLTGIAWVKTCGGLYSFLTRDAPRAPQWMQRAGLEWLHRAGNDPSRLLYRYLVTSPVALMRLALQTKRAPK